jgi:predicted component of type VI protein secretion system
MSHKWIGEPTMTTVLRLTVLTGPHKNERFCLCGSARCFIGRADDCFVQLTGTWRDEYISRHHCEVIVEPPLLTLKDLASRNGTYFNGSGIDSLELALTETEDGKTLDNGPTLNQGDLLTVGGTTFRLDLVRCPPTAQVAAPASFWRKGENAKKDCPILCGNA